MADGYTARPWLPPIAAHTAALANWRTRVQRIPNNQEISPQTWARRHLRFIASAELWIDRLPSGGMAAQLSLLSAVSSVGRGIVCFRDRLPRGTCTLLGGFRTPPLGYRLSFWPIVA